MHLKNTGPPKRGPDTQKVSFCMFLVLRFTINTCKLDGSVIQMVNFSSIGHSKTWTIFGSHFVSHDMKTDKLSGFQVILWL
jgi:hypothetical protein